MGQTAENLAYRFGITRREMDEYAARSHQRVLAGQRAGHYAGELVPIFDKAGKLYAADDGVREDSTAENLAKLRPFFDRKYGNVTAGNSSQITDGGAWLVIASAKAVEEHKLTPIGRIVDTQWAGLDPAQMGLGPVHAATPILQRHNLALNDLDAWEINEAFAAQVIACERAWESDDYCRNELGLPGPLGRIDPDKLNVDGGAIALGHPVGASGTRIVLHVLNVLRRTGGKRGMAAICIGGGLGGAMLDRTGVTPATTPNTGNLMQHWTLTRDTDDLAWLTFDRAGATANTLSAAVLAELHEALDVLDRAPPKGLVIRSGKANGFIAGADVEEFGEVKDDAGALAIVKRGWDAFERLAAVAYPTLALVRGFCLGGGLELALACRYRVVVDEPGTRLGLPEVMLGIVPGWGGIKRLPQAGRRARCARPAPHRQDDRRAPREEAGHRRRVRSGADHGRDGARRAARAAAAAFAQVPAVADAEPARAAVHRGVGREEGRTARAPRTLSGAVRGARPVGEIRRQRAGGARLRSRVDPCAVPLADRGQPHSRVPPAGAAEEPGQGRRVPRGACARRRCGHDGRRHRGVVRVARPDGDAAGPERGASGAGDAAGGQTLRAAAARSAPRARCDRPADPRCRWRRRRARRRDHRGDLRERRGQARAVRRAGEEGETRRDPCIEHVEHSAGGHRAGDGGSGAPDRAPLLQSGGEDDAGRDRRWPADARRAGAAGGGLRAPDRQAAAAGEKRARIPRQSRAGAVPDGSDALRGRRHSAGDRRRSRAGVRHADGTDRTGRHRRPRHLRRRRQAARRRRRATKEIDGRDRRRQPGPQDGPRLLRVGRRQAAEGRRRRRARRAWPAA